jgi:hypothetical protein
MKKHNTIHVCVDYRDINKYCPKENYPTPFTNQIVDDSVESEIFSLIDGFSGYNQINILPTNQHKTAFIFTWGTFTYWKLPFGLKNTGVTFQCVMSYPIYMIFWHILCIIRITQHIYEPFSYTFIIITYV